MDGIAGDTINFLHDDVIKWKLFPLLALCAGNSPVTGEFPSQRPVTQSFDVFFDMHHNGEAGDLDTNVHIMTPL